MVYILLVKQKREMLAVRKSAHFFRGGCSHNTGLTSKQKFIKLMSTAPATHSIGCVSCV